MGKKIKTVTVFRKVDYHKPIPFKDINIDLEPDDRIFSGFEEAEYRSDGGMDSHWYMTIDRDRLETDEEHNKRLFEEEKTKNYLRSRRLNSYIKLKEEFKDTAIGKILINTIGDSGRFENALCSECNTVVETNAFECPNCKCIFIKKD